MRRFEPESAGVVRRGALLAIVIAVIGLTQYATDRPLQAQAGPHSLEALLTGTGFVRIPAGEFLMGSSGGLASEAPVHRVRISTGFEMGRFEVTQSQWEAVMRSAHQTREPGVPKDEAQVNANPSFFKGATSPVEKVSWNDVQRFLATLNGRDANHVYRLPTEAEWEYASRAGSNEESIDDLKRLAWFKDNSEGRPQAAGQKEPNAWGLYDMHGNVSEWVQDWYGIDYYENSPATDPTGPESGSYRVFRGCSWFGPAADCRSAIRLFNFPIDGYYNVGFRLVRTAK